MFIDTHCHLDFEKFDGDRDAVIARALEAGVERVIVPALHPSNWQTVLHLTQQYPPLYAALGIHPNSSQDWQEHWLDDLRPLLNHPKVVAIGEIGLDYYWKLSPKETQHQALAAQLRLAAEVGLPVILHNREADTDLLQLLAASPLVGRSRIGVLHSFASSWKVAKTALDMGFYIGFTGPLTYKNGDVLRTVAAQIPLDRLLLETDAPFLPPHPHRGKRNEPAYIPLIAERVAGIHNLPLPAIAQQTSSNARYLFHLK